ncbi:Lrp/AsnC family transcriptional regulator, partial [Candidatus Bathyarchaeota archaeon]
EIERYRGVSEVLVTYGMWDLVIKLETENLKELDKIVTKIRQMSDIEQTHTLIGVKD